MATAGALTGSRSWLSETAPTRRRFAFALALSLALHAAVVVGVRAGRGAGSPGERVSAGNLLTARLVPLEAAALQMTPEATPTDSPTRSVSESVAPAAADAARKPRRPLASGTLPLDFIQAGYYYLASKVHKPPVLLGDIHFEYPDNSPLRNGIVQARVLVNARGSVDDAIIETADPPGVFDAVAIRALLAAKYSPGLLHGFAVPTQLMVEVRYLDPGSSTLPGVNISVKQRSP